MRCARACVACLVVACASQKPATVEERENIALAREQRRQRLFTWEPWSKETFARAAKENRPILLHGAAEWCHWCHVMEETTYLDDDVGALVRDRFIAIRVDIDERPDFAERYSAWGWPATIILSPSAEELGMYRGYLPPERMKEILDGVRNAGRVSATESAELAAPVDALPWIAARTEVDLDALYDEEHGSWGFRQKMPLGHTIESEIRRAARGDEKARARVIFTLDQQRALLDPVWGGLYQYSTSPDWKTPHFEKLITIQAPALEASARAYALTHEARFLDDALAIERYLRSFLMTPHGTFLVNQDADLGAHDKAARFVDGHTYYALSDGERRKLGLPWVDPHVYARENGMAIQALLALHDVTGDDALLTRARTAADAILATHVKEDGRVMRDAESPSSPFFLADAASFGRAIALIAAKDARYTPHALRIAQAAIAQFSDGERAFWNATPDPDAAGVFTRRSKALAHNIAMVRFLASLHALTHDEAWCTRAIALLAASATPRALKEEGRMVGVVLLALDEVGVAWGPR